MRWLVLFLVGVLLAGLTGRRMAVWSDEPTLWREAVTLNPHSPRAWINYGAQLEQQGFEGLAADAYRQADEEAQRSGRTHEEQIFGQGIARANLARLSAQRGDYLEAKRLLNPMRALVPTPVIVTNIYQWIETQERLSSLPLSASF